MNFCFLTRDSGPGEDYPRIGWIPPLPTDAGELWEQYGNLSAPEYPEIILSGHQGVWRLFLSAIDSGRMDCLVGRGRVIRMTLYVTGRADEGERIVGLVDQFLRETLSRESSSSLLSDLFACEIQHGDPVKWKDTPADEQDKISARILSRLTDIPRRTQSQSISEGSWMGGYTAANLEKFVSNCNAILTGKDGTALSLANLSSSEIGRVLGKNGDGESIAVLLTTEEEKSSPWRRIPIDSFASSDQRKGPFCSQNVRDILRISLIVGVSIISLIMIVLSLTRDPPKKDAAEAIPRGGASQPVGSSGK